MIRTLIIEDEPKNRIRLRNMIESDFPNIDLAGEADGVKTGIEAINSLKPELVLLDIRLADGDAFELLDKAGEITFKIIFITAYEEYALKAIKFSALDYLLKPISSEDLKLAIDKAEQQIMNELRLKLSTLQLNLNPDKKNKTIVLRTMNKIYLVEIMEIIRCESDGSYTRVFTKEGKEYMVSVPMKEYEDILLDHGFFRIHKSHIINLSYIESFDKEGYVRLKDTTSLPVSRRKKNELLEVISKL
jgi:two-component system LytT family response regulator